MSRHYYFDEMGGWLSQPPKAIDFSSYPDDHASNSFEWAADWLIPEWAEFLSQRPHPKSGDFDCDFCNLAFETWKGER